MLVDLARHEEWAAIGTGGMVREDVTKSKADQRLLPLPNFAIAMLMRRQGEAFGKVHDVVFPSTTGNLRDPSG
jgi:hypothetical protein